MKKKVLFKALISSYLLLIAFFASGDNILIIHNVTADAGSDITVEIEIQNDQDFIGFNCDILLPPGFSLIPNSGQLFRTDADHQLILTVINDNVVRLMSYSLTNSFHTGNDGIIVSFDLQTPQIGGEYMLEITGNPVIGTIINGSVVNIISGVINGTVILESIFPDPECPDDMVVCLIDEAFLLTGAEPTGGYYSGPGVLDGVFYPEIAGAGVHEISYSISLPGLPGINQGLKADDKADKQSVSCVFYIQVLPVTEPTFAQIGPFCLEEEPDPLPPVSTNSITGTWFPGYIDTSASGTFIYTFYPNEEYCAIPVEIEVTIVEPETPVFDTIEPICLDAEPPVLPGVSVNGITGTWFPAAINTVEPGVAIHTFYPGEGECAVLVEMEITVVEPEVPLFDPLDPVCQGTEPPVLPGVSVNGIPGTWFPAAINTGQPGVAIHTFYPGEEECAVPVEIEVTVIEPDVPLFDPLEPICQGAEPPVLPGVSVNGIPGTWFPAAINTGQPGVAIHTFYPGEEECAIPVEMEVTVIEPEVPVFDAIEPICQGTEPPVLPGVSVNGITGIWDPVVIDTNTPGIAVHTFYPHEEECAIPVEMEVFVIEPEVPVFDAIEPICQGAEPPVLPGVSANGISGTWFPAAINTGEPGVAIYTFYPAEEECAIPVEIEVTVIEPEVPVFDAIEPICLGAEPPALPGVSANGISGTWDPAVIDTNNPGIAVHTFYPHEEECAFIAEINVVIYELPSVTCPNDIDLYTTDEPLLLTGAIPEGGTYLGEWVINETFDPHSAGPGAHEIFYFYDDPETGCTNTCSFFINVSVPPELIAECPDDVIISSCTSQNDINNAFELWLNGFVFSGGCDEITEHGLDGLLPPNSCGGEITVFYTVNDSCGQQAQCTANFHVTAAPVLQLSCPSDHTEDPGQSQEAIDIAFANWLASAYVEGGCETQLSTIPENPLSPDATGGETLVTWIATDNCGQQVECTGLFSVETGVFTVNFIITDTTGSPIPGATIIFDGIQQPAGQYTFVVTSPGTYAYSIIKAGYQTIDGIVEVIATDVTITVELLEETTLPVDLEIAVTENVIIDYEACYNAWQSITVAGSEYVFNVLPGGDVTMIAGENILLLPGTVIEKGAYFHAFISLDDFCGIPANKEETEELPLASETNILEVPGRFFNIYPNPTTGEFFVKLDIGSDDQYATVEVFDIEGRMVRSLKIQGDAEYRMELNDQLPGMYIIRIIYRDRAGAERIIKR